MHHRLLFKKGGPGFTQDGFSKSIGDVDGTRGTILVVEDDELVARSLVRFFGQYRDVLVAEGIDDALRVVDGGTALEALVLDWQLPDGDGVRLLQELRERWPALPVLFITAFLDGDCINAIHALRAEFASKPLSEDNLRAFADRVFGVQDTERRLQALRAFVTKHHLSPTESKIARLVVEGVERSALAEELGVAESTIKTLVRRILTKCQLSNLQLVEQEVSHLANGIPRDLRGSDVVARFAASDLS